MKYRFRFQALLNSRRHQLELRRQILAQLQSDERELIDRRRSVDQQRLAWVDQLRKIGNMKRISITATRARRTQVEKLQRDLQAFDRELELVRRQFRLCRQAVVELARAVEVLERLHARQRADWVKAENNRDMLYAHEQLRLWPSTLTKSLE